MSDWITRLRRQPKSIRNQVALMGAFVCTLCIAAVWLVSTPFSGTFATNELPETKGAWAQFTERVGAQAATVWQSLSVTEAAPATTPTTTPTRATTTADAAVVVPKLSTTTITTVNTPPPKTILIATTSTDQRPPSP